MLYVVLNNGVERTWHIDQDLSGLLDNIHLVKEVQADGDELVWVHKNITGIPQCNPMIKRVQIWFGDDAKFIANCIPSKY